jgi:hypothetical protein
LVQWFIKDSKVSVKNSLRVFTGLHTEESSCLLQSVLAYWAYAKGDLTSFSILFIYAQFFDTPVFRSFLTLYFHGFSEGLGFCWLWHVFGYNATLRIQRLFVANEMV